MQEWLEKQDIQKIGEEIRMDVCYVCGNSVSRGRPIDPSGVNPNLNHHSWGGFTLTRMGFAEKWGDEKITDGRFNEQDVFIRYMSNIKRSMESDFT